jgi:hypothetical protein
MRISTISVQVRYSKPMADGSHKTVELGVEGSLTDSTEDWQEVQRDLYKDLGSQMRYAFSGNGTGIATGKAQVASERHIRPVPELPEPPPAHYCTQHRTPFTKFSKNGRSWWSHRHGNGWCREA